jgi:hypothetical protein
MSAIKAVAGVPPSAKTAGTPKPMHCVELGTRPRCAYVRASCSTNQSFRFSAVSAISKNSECESDTLLNLPVVVFNQKTAPPSSCRNNSPKTFLATSVIREGQSHRQSERAGRFRGRPRERILSLCHLLASILHDARLVPGSGNRKGSS